MHGTSTPDCYDRELPSAVLHLVAWLIWIGLAMLTDRFVGTIRALLDTLFWAGSG